MFDSAISSTPRLRDCRFSSATSGARSANNGPSASMKPLNGASIETVSSRTPSDLHCTAARSFDRSAVKRDGKRTAVTFSAPIASTAMASTTDESSPPDRPSHTLSNPFFAQ